MDYSALILDVFLALISYNSGFLNDPSPEISPHEPFEYCNGDEFRPRCGSDEVVAITEATYGRVSVGRCFRSGEQQFGCIANFTEHLDTECSGLRSCTVRVPTATMNSVDKCRPLRSALHASYRCIKVVGGSCRQECRNEGRVRLTGDRGYLPSTAADRDGCGSARCPWSIQVLPGQSISIALFDFTARQRQSAVHQRHAVPSSGRCSHQLVTIKERTLAKEMPVCGGRERQRQLYVSVSHFLEVLVLNEDIAYGSGQFLVYYEAIGCPDVIPPKWSRMKRLHDRCEIDCPENPSHKWILNCVNNQWVGDVGSCPPLSLGEIATADKPNTIGSGSFISTLPLNVLVTFAVAVTVIIGVIIITTGMVCLKKNSYQDRHRPESVIYTGVSSEFEFRADLVGARSALVAKTSVHEASSLSTQSSKPRRPSTDLLMPVRDNTYAAERCMESRPLPAIPDSNPQSSIQRDSVGQIAVQVHPNVAVAEMCSSNQPRPVVVACRGGTSTGVARDGRRPQPPMKPPGRGGVVAGAPSVQGDNHHYFVLDPDILVEEPATLRSVDHRTAENQTQAVPMQRQIFPDEHNISGPNRIKAGQCDTSANNIPLRPIRDSSGHQRKHSQQKFNDSGIGSWP